MKTIDQMVKSENPNDLYWWARWPKNPSADQQDAIDFLLTRYPKTISIGVQIVADLMLEYHKSKSLGDINDT